MLKIKQTVLILTLVLSLCGSFFISGEAMAAKCAGVETSIIGCEQEGVCQDGSLPDTFNKCDDGSEPRDIKIEQTGIWGILMLVINIMTAGIAVVAVGGVAYAAVLYASAGGRVDQVKKAVQVIMNIIAGAAMYAIAWSLLNWLIPGGAF